jgi:hypothetical protein
MNSLHGARVWLAVCNRLRHERRSNAGNASCDTIRDGPRLPAALLMSSVQAALKPLIGQRLAPGELCHQPNRTMCDVTPVGKFISFFYLCWTALTIA